MHSSTCFSIHITNYSTIIEHSSTTEPKSSYTKPQQTHTNSSCTSSKTTRAPHSPQQKPEPQKTSTTIHQYILPYQHHKKKTPHNPKHPTTPTIHPKTQTNHKEQPKQHLNPTNHTTQKDPTPHKKHHTKTVTALLLSSPLLGGCGLEIKKK